MKNIKLMRRTAAVGSALMFACSYLAGCGDEVTEVTSVTEKASLEQVKKFKELPKCEEDAEGSLVYVKDSAKVFVCTGDGWSQMNGIDGEKGAKGDKGAEGTSCTAKQNKAKTGFDIVCGGKTVGTIKNGEKGEKGADGEKGDEGTSCTAKQNKAKTGFDIVCGGKTVGSIKNGEAGEKGDDCSLTDGKDGQVLVTCGENSVTLFKATCGSKPFDPETQFCEGGVPYRRCYIIGEAKNGVEIDLVPFNEEEGTYDVSKYFCDEKTDSLVRFCNSAPNQPFDVTEKFCGEHNPVDRCDTVAEGVPESALRKDGSYAVGDYFCVDGVLWEGCGPGGRHNNTFNPDSQFCDRSEGYGTVREKCGGKTYENKTQMCVDGQVEDAIDCCVPKGQNSNWCSGHGSSKYDVRKQFCDTRDGHPYAFTTITKRNEDDEVVYSRTWMAENLKYTNTTAGEYKIYSGDTDCDNHGCYYTWNAAKSYCPDDWDLPSRDEYQALLDIYGTAAPATKAYLLEGPNGETYDYNETGFSATATNYFSQELDGQGREHYVFAGSSDYGDGGFYWTSKGEVSNNAYFFFVNAQIARVSKAFNQLNYLSVRCIKKEN